MIIYKSLDCGIQTLVLKAEHEDEGEKLGVFALPGEPLVAEIRNINGHGLPDLVIKKKVDQ